MGNPSPNRMDEEKSVGVRLHACPDTKNSFWPITSGHSKRRNKFFRFRDPLDIPEDVKKRKNLKHYDVNCIHEFSRNLDDSRSSRTSDALNYVPKTSELLSCKKLIAEASKLKNVKIRFSATEEVGKTAELSHRRSIDEVGGKIISCQQHNKLRQLGNIVERSSTKEINNALSDKCKYSRDLLPMDLTAPEHLNIYSAVVKFEEQGGKCRNLEGGKRKSLEGIFSEKRHNIIKIAAENFSLQVNDLVSKGYNLIPDLLQRLGVANEPNNVCTFNPL
ncbi:hypothetical protein ZOSMA_42G01260 [Zostera marina]|uniref:Uncharacterized protein n=1 Tax=Zostera marina TaxID=29655 RepID=A0A0K9P205_ZOSMR|nr:hypothetical protein ZOSMA_42G01260 [Zostera marina]